MNRIWLQPTRKCACQDDLKVWLLPVDVVAATGATGKLCKFQSQLDKGAGAVVEPGHENEGRGQGSSLAVYTQLPPVYHTN